MTELTGKEWDALDALGDPSALKGAEALKGAADALLALPLDDDSSIPAQLLQALRLAKAAIKGERKRVKDAEKRAASGGDDKSTQRALEKAEKEAAKTASLTKEDKFDAFGNKIEEKKEAKKIPKSELKKIKKRVAELRKKGQEIWTDEEIEKEGYEIPV